MEGINNIKYNAWKKSEVEGLCSKADEIAAKLASVDEKTINYAEAIDAIQTKLSALEAKIMSESTLNTSLNSLKTEMTAVKNAVTSLNSGFANREYGFYYPYETVFEESDPGPYGVKNFYDVMNINMLSNDSDTETMLIVICDGNISQSDHTAAMTLKPGETISNLRCNLFELKLMNNAPTSSTARLPFRIIYSKWIRL